MKSFRNHTGVQDGQEGEVLPLPLGKEGERPGGYRVRESQEGGPESEE